MQDTFTYKEVVAIYDQVEKMASCRPIITMGAACYLLAGLPPPRTSDLDMLISSTSLALNGIAITQNPPYSGKKRVLEVGGATVELLSDFVTDVGGTKFYHDGVMTGVFLKLENGKTRLVNVSPPNQLYAFYSGMNRDKDQVKLNMLRKTEWYALWCKPKNLDFMGEPFDGIGLVP